jgi:hypothetical protein
MHCPGSVVLAHQAGVLIVPVVAAAAQGPMIALGAVEAAVHGDVALDALRVEVVHGEFQW